MKIIKRTFLTLFVLINFLFVSKINAQDFTLGLKGGIGNYTFKTAKGKAFLKEFPDTKFSQNTFGLELKYVLKNNVFFALHSRFFSQSFEEKQVIIPPFIYSDYWADINIKFNRIQNFIGFGYTVKKGKINFIPQFDFMLSFANDFDVNLAINEDAANIPITGNPDPNFEVGFSEYGARFSLGIGYQLSKNISLNLTPNYYLGEMELVVQSTPTFTGGDIKTSGYGVDLTFSYSL